MCDRAWGINPQLLTCVVRFARGAAETATVREGRSSRVLELSRLFAGCALAARLFAMLRNDDTDQPGVPGVCRARILVVEDNAPNRQLLHDILELRGHDVLVAANVDEATRALADLGERVD